jgi:hypothetical protein
VPSSSDWKGKSNFIKRVACLHNAKYDKPLERVDGPGPAAFLLVGLNNNREIVGASADIDPTLFDNLVQEHLYPAPNLLWVPIKVVDKRTGLEQNCGVLQVNIGQSPLHFRQTALTTNKERPLYLTKPTRVGTSNTIKPLDHEWLEVLARFYGPQHACAQAFDAAREAMRAVGADHTVATRRVLLLGPGFPALAVDQAAQQLLTETLSRVDWDLVIDATWLLYDSDASRELMRELIVALTASTSRTVHTLEPRAVGKFLNAKKEDLPNAGSAMVVIGPPTVKPSAADAAQSSLCQAAGRALEEFVDVANVRGGAFICVDGPTPPDGNLTAVSLAKHLFGLLHESILKWAFLRFSPAAVPHANHLYQILTDTVPEWLAIGVNPIAMQHVPELPGIGIVDAQPMLALQAACEVFPPNINNSVPQTLDPQIEANYRRGGEATADVLAVIPPLVVQRECMGELVQRINAIRRTHMSSPSAKGRIQALTLPHLPTTGASTIARRVAWDLRNEWIALVVTARSTPLFTFEHLLQFASSAAASKPVWFLVVADNVKVDVDELRKRAVGDTLRGLHVLVLHLQRCNSRPEYDAACQLSGSHHMPLTITAAEAKHFDRIFTKLSDPDAPPHLFMWGLCTFLRQYEKIASHLQAVGQHLQTCTADLAKLRVVVQLSCIFRAHGLGGVPRASLPAHLDLTDAHLDPLRSVLLVSPTTISAPVTEHETLAILFGWGERLFCAPVLTVSQFPAQASATCLMAWLKSVPFEWRETTGGQRSELQKICFPLLIDRTGRQKFSPFVQMLYDQDYHLAVDVLKAAVDALPQEAHFRAHLGRLLSFAGEHANAINLLLQAWDMCTEAEHENRIPTMLGNAIRFAVAAHIQYPHDHTDADIPALIGRGLEAYQAGRHFGLTINTHAYLGEIKFRCVLQSTPRCCPEHNFASALELFDRLSTFNASNQQMFPQRSRDLVALWDSLVQCGLQTLHQLVDDNCLGPVSESSPSALQELAVLGVVESPLCSADWQRWPMSTRRAIHSRLVDRVDANTEKAFSSDYRALLWVTRQLYPASPPGNRSLCSVDTDLGE